MNRFALFITLLLATLGVGLPLSAQQAPTYTTIITTSTPEEPVFYLICSSRAIVFGGGSPTYLASDYNYGKARRTDAESALTYWIFEDATAGVPHGTTVPAGVKPVYIYSPFTAAYLIYGDRADDAASPYMTVNPDEKQIWYLVPNGNPVNDYRGVGISTVAPTDLSDDFTSVTLSGNNVLLEAGGGHPTVGRWNSTDSYRDDGNTWFLSLKELTDAEKTSVTEEARNNIAAPLFNENVTGLWTAGQFDTYKYAMDEAARKATIAEMAAAKTEAANALFDALNGTHKSFSQVSIDGEERKLSLNTFTTDDGTATQLWCVPTDKADCNSIFTIEAIKGTATFRLRTFEGQYVGPSQWDSYISTVSDADKAGIFTLSPWICGNAQQGIGIQSEINTYFCQEDPENEFRVVGSNAPEGEYSPSGWHVADMTQTLDEINADFETKKTEAFRPVYNALAAWALFPDYVFDSRQIKEVRNEADWCVSNLSLPGSTLLTDVPGYKCEISPYLNQLLTYAAKSADGKVVAFKNTENGDRYLNSPANSALNVADGLAPRSAWILTHADGVTFRLQNLDTKKYIGNANNANVPLTDAEDAAGLITFAPHMTDNVASALFLEIATTETGNDAGQKRIAVTASSDGVEISDSEQSGSQWQTEAIVLPEKVTVEPKEFTNYTSPAIGWMAYQPVFTATVEPSNVTSGFGGIDFEEVWDNFINSREEDAKEITIYRSLTGESVIKATAKYNSNAYDEAYLTVKGISFDSEQMIDNITATVIPGEIEGTYRETTIDIPFKFDESCAGFKPTEEMIANAYIDESWFQTNENDCLTMGKPFATYENGSIVFHFVATKPGKGEVYVSFVDLFKLITIDVVSAVTGIKAEIADPTLVLDQERTATTSINGSVSPEEAPFTVREISAEATPAEGISFGDVAKTETGNGFTIPVTAAAPGTYSITVKYTDGGEVICAEPVSLIVTNPAPEDGFTPQVPDELPADTGAEVSDDGKEVNVAFVQSDETVNVELLTDMPDGVNPDVFYKIVYDDVNEGGRFVKAEFDADNKSALKITKTGETPDVLPFSTVIKVVKTAPDGKEETVFAINASINAAKIQSVTITNGSSIRIFLNETVALAAAIVPDGAGNNVTFTVTDEAGNEMPLVNGNEFTPTATGTYIATATVDGTVPAVTATSTILVSEAVTGIEAEIDEPTLVLGEDGASTIIRGSISPEVALFDADEITAVASPDGGIEFGNVAKTEIGNGFTIPVTAAAPGTYSITVKYTNANNEVISAEPVSLIVTNPAPEDGFTPQIPDELPPDTGAEVSDDGKEVNVAFVQSDETVNVELPTDMPDGVNPDVFYKIVYDDVNEGGRFVKAEFDADNKSALKITKTGETPDVLPFSTVIKVVKTAPDGKEETVFAINASINAAKIQSVTITNGSSIRIFLNETVALAAAIVPVGVGNNVTFTVTDEAGNEMPLVNGNEFTPTATGTYIATATVDGTVPAVTATSTIIVSEAVSGIETINTDAAEGRTEIYDLSGRRIRRIDAAGVYIVNGRKLIVR